MSRPSSTPERDTELLTTRLKGSTLTALGKQLGITAEGARQLLERAGRRHVSALIPQIWAAQKEGSLLALAVPAALAQDDRHALSYFEFVLDELVRQDVEPRVHYRPASDGGFIMAVEDASFTRLLKEKR